MTGNPLAPILSGPSGPPGRKPLHVLTLTPFYPTDEDDGAGCFVAEPLDVLNQAEVRSTVFAVQPIYRPTARTRQGKTRAAWLRYFSLPGGIGLPTAGAFVFARIVSRVRTLHRLDLIQVIHAHGALPCGHAAMLLSAELGVPYVVSVHGLDAFSTTQVGGRSGEWCRRISQRVYRSSRRVLCVSERVREEVLNGVACRTSVIYNGVNPELFSPDAVSLSGVGTTDSSSSVPTVLSVGNLIPIKGHDVLIRAIASILPEFPNLTLEIIGEGPESSRLRTLTDQLGITQHVKFSGRRSRDQVAAAMRHTTIFALPSRYEGLGCVYLEAMSCGRPVIGCRGQGIAEVIQQGSNGFLVGADNDRELALAMAMLLRDETMRRRVGRAARETILDRFTLPQQAQTLSRIYRESAG